MPALARDHAEFGSLAGLSASVGMPQRARPYLGTYSIAATIRSLIVLWADHSRIPGAFECRTLLRVRSSWKPRAQPRLCREEFLSGMWKNDRENGRWNMANGRSDDWIGLWGRVGNMEHRRTILFCLHMGRCLFWQRDPFAPGWTVSVCTATNWTSEHKSALYLVKFFRNFSTRACSGWNDSLVSGDKRKCPSSHDSSLVTLPVGFAPTTGRDFFVNTWDVGWWRLVLRFNFFFHE